MRQTILLLTVFVFAGSLWAADPHVGTWKMNAAKSKFGDQQPYKSDTVRFEAIDNGVKVVADAVDAEGKALHEEVTAKYDGKDYPYPGNPHADTMSFKRIDADTFDQVMKKNGKVMATAREIFSKDGKTLTRTIAGKDDNGKNFIISIVVYEKQ
jgi:hypothetical protein